MKITFLSVLFIFFGIHTLSAQSVVKSISRKNSINVSIGWAKSFFKDENYAPLKYTSNNFAIDVGYQRSFKNDDLLFFSSFFQTGTLTTPTSPFNDSDHYNVNIELGYLFKVSNENAKTNIYVGGQYHSYLDLVFYDGTEAISFFGLHSLDVSTRFSKRIHDKHVINTNFSLPLAGVLVRPPYTGWDKYIVEHADNPLPVFFRGDFTSLKNFFAFIWDVQYHLELSPFFGLNANYQFRYNKTSVLETAIISNNRITLGTMLKF